MQLIRVPRIDHGFRGYWQPLFFCPDPASPQEFIVGIACSAHAKIVRWKLLGDFEKLQCVYGSRISIGSLKSYFAAISNMMFEAESAGQAVPEIAEMSNQLRWGEPISVQASSAEQCVEELFHSMVALAVDEKSPRNKVFKSRSTDVIRKTVNERLKVRLAMNFEQIVNERGFEEISDANGKHRLNVNLRKGTRVGTVVSAWYGSLDGVASQILQAEADLTAAQKHYGARKAGLFVMRPFELPGVKKKVIDDIDAFLDHCQWRCSTRGNLYNHDEEEDRLADAIAEFF